ncbi:MAG: RNA-binding S4 domain-containing protein [Candidatus Omnitrophota bacterium]|jgi:ribosome-associated protein|nr:RNA-binding S4 domain-containing protein [Candidatus Omnitrophota bacterium]MDD5526434.1 RNA-binding S4 domain-containing protein [Candidatus Omnitrophota bacterium]
MTAMGGPVDLELKGEYIELDNLLKNAGIASSGGEAGQFIRSGSVKVNGETETRVRRKLRRGDSVESGGLRINIV